MNQRPSGRDRSVSGTGKGVYRRGEGLGTGPAGRGTGYSGRPQTPGGRTPSGGGRLPSGGNRAPFGGRNSSPTGIVILVVLILIFLIGGGGFGAASLFGLNIHSGAGWSGTASSTSSGWVQKANTGVLNTEAAPGARAKYVAPSAGGNVTVMIYLCGTDLESKNGMGTADVKEMCGAALSDRVNLLVYTGGCRSWQNGTFSSSVNQIYKIENGAPKLLVKDDGNGSMTDPATLTHFIRCAADKYPAERNILVLWDHGAGSISGYGYDERHPSSSSMTLKGIDTALKEGGVKFDIVGFDACLMATYENALMLEKHADYLLASEETEPGVGWYYKNWLTALSADPGISSLELGKMIADDYTKTCASECPGQKTTLSLVDLADLAAAVPDKLNVFARETAALVQSDGYQSVSDARAASREFGVSSRVDQVDLAHLAYNLGTEESKALMNAVLGSVKYNRTSSQIANAFGLSVYFPYRKVSQVDAALQTYEELGLDGDYAACIRTFAGMETAGQQISGDESPLPSLLGNFTGHEAASQAQVTDLLYTLFSADSIFHDLSGGRASQYLTEHQFDSSRLIWTKTNGGYEMRLDEKQWALVQDLQLNVFYDDGEGYIDLGLDTIYSFNGNGSLDGSYDGAWIAIDDQPVPYYHENTFRDGGAYCITGRVPILLNGARADLILVFDNAHPYGTISGARYVYQSGETETAAKEIASLTPGDRIEYVCDYYSYNGIYQNSYLYGEAWIWSGNHRISDVWLPEPERASAIYLFTDIYNGEHWSELIPRD